VITGKTVSVHITQQDVHVVEAETEKGKLTVYNAFTLHGFDRFFDTKGRLTNLAGLVDNIVMACKANGVTTKRMSICFADVFQTSFSIEPITGAAKKRTLNLNMTIGGGGEKKDAPRQTVNTATITKRHSWGQYITQDEQGEAVSVTQAEKDLVESLVNSFTTAGFKVVSLETPDTALVYARNTNSYSYDSLNKIVLHSEDGTSGNLYVFTKDVPSVIKRVNFDMLEGNNLIEKTVSACSAEVQTGQMRNPQVALVGNAFHDTETYLTTAEQLLDAEIEVCDLYGSLNVMPKEGAVLIGFSSQSGLAETGLGCEYGIAICTLLRCFDEKPQSIVEVKSSVQITAKDKFLFFRMLKIAAAIFLAVNLILTGITAVSAFSLSGKMQDSTAMNSRLTRVTALRDTARTQLDTLSTLDDRIEQVFLFTLENVDSTVNIASIDTEDMLATDTSSQPADAAAADGTETTDPNSPCNYVPQRIIVRGYSTQSSGAIALFNALDGANIGSVKLVGHQQINLPSGEAIYAFEINIEGGTAA